MFAAVGAPLLTEQFADRDGAGKVVTGRLWREADRREFEAPDWKGSSAKTQGPLAVLGVNTETLVWRVERRYIPDGFLPLGGAELVELSSRPGETFAVDLDRTVEGEVVVTIGLTRSPLASMAQHERGAAQR